MQDSNTLIQLKQRINSLRGERDELLRDVLDERKIANEMETELQKMRKEKE